MRRLLVLMFGVVVTSISFFGFFPCIYVIYKGNTTLSHMQESLKHSQYSEISHLRIQLVERNIEACQLTAVMLLVVFLAGSIILFQLKKQGSAVSK